MSDGEKTIKFRITATVEYEVREADFPPNIPDSEKLAGEEEYMYQNMAEAMSHGGEGVTVSVKLIKE